jgi:hypothetical protein
LACWFFSFLFGPGHMEPASSAQLGHCFQVLSWPSVVLLAARGTCYVTGWARASAVMDWFSGSYHTSIKKPMSLSVHIPSFLFTESQTWNGCWHHRWEPMIDSKAWSHCSMHKTWRLLGAKILHCRIDEVDGVFGRAKP